MPRLRASTRDSRHRSPSLRTEQRTGIANLETRLVRWMVGTRHRHRDVDRRHPAPARMTASKSPTAAAIRSSIRRALRDDQVPDGGTGHRSEARREGPVGRRIRASSVWCEAQETRFAPSTAACSSSPPCSAFEEPVSSHSGRRADRQQLAQHCHGHPHRVGRPPSRTGRWWFRKGAGTGRHHQRLGVAPIAATRRVLRAGGMLAHYAPGMKGAGRRRVSARRSRPPNHTYCCSCSWGCTKTRPFVFNDLTLVKQTVGTPQQTVGTPQQTVGTPQQTVGTPQQTVGTPTCFAATCGLRAPR